MILNFIKILARTSLLLIIYLFASCHSNNEKTTEDYSDYTFDSLVIEKLPVYDSLANAILESFPLFKKSINLNDSYRAYKYMPLSNKTDVFTKLPQESGTKIDQYYTSLGKDFIYGFDIFEDSTIKIYIRTRISEKTLDDFEENLSYYPNKINIQRREFPDKDTILNKYWQYWIRYNKRSLF